MIAASAEAFGVGVLVSGFLLGFRHGIDWDHIAAITDITSSQDERRHAVRLGTLYALGHALVVLAIGSFAVVLGENLPEGMDEVMGRIVGVTLLVLGVYVIVSLIRHGREFRMRSRWMLIFAGARSAWRRVRPSSGEEIVDLTAAEHEHAVEPVHVHAGGGGSSLAVAVAEDVPVSEWHHGHHGLPGHHHHKHPEPDTFATYGSGSAFLVGMLHGVGGETPTQVLLFLTVAGVGGKVAGELVLVAFLIGLLGSNTLITISSSWGFLKASQNWAVYATVAVLTAVFSLVLGTIFLLGQDAVLPAILGG